MRSTSLVDAFSRCSRNAKDLSTQVHTDVTMIIFAAILKNFNSRPC
jgi:hypothetical protein